MLKTLDVLIGVSTIMLLGSMIVMAITHFLMVITVSRGALLKAGLSELLQQLSQQAGAGSLDSDVAKRIIGAVLSYPQIKSAAGKTGAVLHQNEFITILLELAAGTGAVTLDGTAISGDRGKLNDILKQAGISDPASTLNNIHTLGEQLARMNPELAASARHNIAIAQEGASRFVNGVHAWFDRTIDRVSERYTFYTRPVTYAVAVLVAFTLQMDVIALVNRLSVDDSGRAAIVQRAIKNYEALAPPAGNEGTPAATPKAGSNTGNNAAAAAAATAPDAPAGQPQSGAATSAAAAPNAAANANPPASQSASPAATSAKTPAEQQQEYDAALNKMKEQVNEYSRDISSVSGMFAIPPSTNQWWSQFKGNMIPGILLSAILMSLGAPFWYKTLGSLIQLRSLAAQKDDEQRAARAAAPAPTALPSIAGGEGEAPPVPQWVRGEQGDLTLVG